MEKLERMEEHLKRHPNDYQTAISFLKNRSKEFDRQRKKVQDKRKKEIAFYKRRLKNGKIRNMETD